MRRVIFLFILFLLFSEVLFSTQVHLPVSPDVSVSREFFNIQTEQDLKPHVSKNVVNSTFQLEGQLLGLSTERGSDDSAHSIYDVYVDLNIPLDQNLKLCFSILASQLNPNTDSLRLYLVLVNGTNVIILGYVVGFEPRDRIPDPKAEQYSYIFHQVGNSTDKWFKGERSVLQDLANKDLSSKTLWRITKLVLGIISYRKESDVIDYKMEGFFNVSETSLYGESGIATVRSNATKVSRPAIFMLITILLLFSILASIVTRPKLNRANQNQPTKIYQSKTAKSSINALASRRCQTLRAQTNYM